MCSAGVRVCVLACAALKRRANRLRVLCVINDQHLMLAVFYQLCGSDTNEAASPPASDPHSYQNIQSKRPTPLSWGEIKARYRKNKKRKAKVSCIFIPNANTARSFDPFVNDQTAPQDLIAE